MDGVSIPSGLEIALCFLKYWMISIGHALHDLLSADIADADCFEVCRSWAFGSSMLGASKVGQSLDRGVFPTRRQGEGEGHEDLSSHGQTQPGCRGHEQIPGETSFPPSQIT